MPPKAFKPPRPTAKASPAGKKSTAAKGVNKASASKPSKSNIRRASEVPRGLLPSLSPDSSPDASAVEIASSPEELPRRGQQDEDEDAEMAEAADESRQARIPPELLTRILQEFFKEDNTRMSKPAAQAVGRYMETFVREAIARAAFGRRQAMGEDGEGGGWLEVSRRCSWGCPMLIRVGRGFGKDGAAADLGLLRVSRDLWTGDCEQRLGATMRATSWVYAVHYQPLIRHLTSATLHHSIILRTLYR